MSQVQRRRVVRGICFVMMIAYTIAVLWLHYQQICATGGGNDPYPSDLGLHLKYAQDGMIYSTALLLVYQFYTLGGPFGIAVLLTIFHLLAVAIFAWGLHRATLQLSKSMCVLVSLVSYLCQAVWVPKGGNWYGGTITGVIYHNTTYIMMAPLALLSVFMFYRTWCSINNRTLNWRTWAIYTIVLTLATSFKANFVFAFAPTLLLLLIFNLIHTRGKNLKNEIVMGCSVLPSIGLCLLESKVLFAGENSGLRLIFTIDFDPHKMAWGLFNQAAVLGLLRSFVFVVVVGIAFKNTIWKSFRYRFSLLLLCVAMAEALLLVENGDRLYHGNLWWGPFICFWIFMFESVSACLQQGIKWFQGERKGHLSLRLLICTIAFFWHAISGIVYFAILLQGLPYGVPI